MAWKRVRRLFGGFGAGRCAADHDRAVQSLLWNNGTIDVFRDDDDQHHDFVDVLIEDVFYDDCLFHHCRCDDYYYCDGTVIFD